MTFPQQENNVKFSVTQTLIPFQTIIQRGKNRENAP